MKTELTRRLAAVMFTDIVGFTELMQKDEQLGLQKRARHKEVFEKYHQIYQGEIIQYWGDGTLSIFTNSVDAVLCAIDIQKELRAPVEVPLRIGIHVGNIVIEPNGIIGDAVNLASRIESFSIPGGILVSDTVHDQIRNQPDIGFVDLGTFNLKNVERPFGIYAISSAGLTVPDPAYLQGKGEKTATLGFHFPSPENPVLGREKELDELIGLINCTKVVTITGPGGMGKTRLSLEICRLSGPLFADGIAFVSLATLTESSEVMQTLATVLDVKQAEGRRFIDGVAALIADKKALLVLDNLEQVISAASEIAELSSRCPNLKILTTSRTPLKIKAEREYSLHPLALPADERALTADELKNYTGIALFSQRAEQARTGFEITEDNAAHVRKICSRLDGLPLALELAAARIRMLTPEALLRRLEHTLDLLTAGSKDMPERHQTLRATISWSYNLLTEPEKQLFRRLSVFEGGFTLEGVEAVGYADEQSAWQALDDLESLVDKGLVQNIAGGERFSMLQTIRDFALEQLTAGEENDETRLRHALYFRQVAGQINMGTHGVQQLKRMKQGALEEANMQSALNYLMECGRKGDAEATELALQLCGEQFMYWHIRGKHVSAVNSINTLLRLPSCPEMSRGKYRALMTLSISASTLGQFEESVAQAKAALEMAIQLNEPEDASFITWGIGFFYMGLDIDQAELYSEQGLEQCRKVGTDWSLAFALTCNGIINAIRGNVDKSRARYQEGLALQRKNGDYEAAGVSLGGLAQLSTMGGDHAGGIELYKEALASFEAVGDRPEEARIHSEMAWTYLAMGNTHASRNHFFNAIQAYQEVGSVRGIGYGLIGLAALESAENRPARAIMIGAAADLFIEQEGIVNMYTGDFQDKKYLEDARKALSTAEIERAEKEGRNLSVKEALLMARQLFVSLPA
jgi:predicted ATPase/class 3 adenylate cyclase